MKKSILCWNPNDPDFWSVCKCAAFDFLKGSQFFFSFTKFPLVNFWLSESSRKNTAVMKPFVHCLPQQCACLCGFIHVHVCTSVSMWASLGIFAAHTQTVSELLIDLCCVWDHLCEVFCSQFKLGYYSRRSFCLSLIIDSSTGPKWGLIPALAFN